MPADLVYYYLPKKYAVSVVTISHLYAGFLGVMVLDVLNHLAFDWRLARSEGWKKPVKAIARIAYFNCRIFPLVVLSLCLAFTTRAVGENIDCNSYVTIVQWMVVPLLNSASLIFVLRTISLYGSKRSVTVPIIIAWLVVFASSLTSLPFWGTAIYIPGTNFCTYVAARDRPARLQLNVLYKAMSLLLDTTVLLLTLHRLMENGLTGLFQRRRAVGVTSLPKVLISQGFFYFVVALFVDVTFMVLYFSQPASNPGLQVAGSAFTFSLPPIVAARLFRTVGKAVNTRHVPTIHPSSFETCPSPTSMASPTVVDSGANSPIKRRSRDATCSCKPPPDEQAFSFNATAAPSTYDSNCPIQQHDIGCAARRIRPCVPQAVVFPSSPRRAALYPPNTLREDDRPPFESYPARPFPFADEAAVQASERECRIHVRTDTVNAVSKEDAAVAASSLFTGYASSSQLDPTEAERRWPQLGASTTDQSSNAVLVESPSETAVVVKWDVPNS